MVKKLFFLIFLFFFSSVNGLVISDGINNYEIDKTSPNYKILNSFQKGDIILIDKKEYILIDKDSIFEDFSLSVKSCDKKHSDYYENNNKYDWCSMSSSQLEQAYRAEYQSVDNYYNCQGKDDGDYTYYPRYRAAKYGYELIFYNYIKKCSTSNNNDHLINKIKSDYEQKIKLYSQTLDKQKNAILQYQKLYNESINLNSKLNQKNTDLVKENEELNSELKTIKLKLKLYDEKTIFDKIKEIFSSFWNFLLYGF